MRLGLNIGYWGAGMGPELELVNEAERLGYEAVWAAEAYGADAVTVLTWIAARTDRIRVGSAILQMHARTPAMTAMTAATLDELSGGRFLLGLGVSGPQVVEGWHGVSYGKPLQRTREYVEVVRRILRRQEPLEHQGEQLSIPYRGPGATGLGKPLKLISHPPNPEMPIYLAAIGPRNVELTAEIADGWLPVFWSPERAGEEFGEALDRGFSKSGDGSKAARFEIAPTVQALVTDDLAAGRDTMRPMLALYLGGMGARGRNFYADLATRYGYGEAVDRVQSAYLEGRKGEAMAAVPDELIDEVALVGPAHRIRDRLDAYAESGATQLLVGTTDLVTLRTLAELAG
jgi:F420-dependent oxidoreductase-like protein